jgi:hypothetical protein
MVRHNKSSSVVYINHYGQITSALQSEREDSIRYQAMCDFVLADPLRCM